MRYLTILTLFLLLSSTACETTSSSPKEELSHKTEVNTTPIDDAQQYKEKFTEREIDSLRVETQTPIVDGIYLVQRHGKSPVNMLPLEPYEKLVTTNGESLNSGAVDHAWTVVNRMHFVPLVLDETPEKSATEDGKAALYLTLNDEQSAAFAELTSNYLNRQIAIVIDEKVCTRHTIKSAITSGNVQISSCSENGCEILLSALEDNVVKH